MRALGILSGLAVKLAVCSRVENVQSELELEQNLVENSQLELELEQNLVSFAPDASKECTWQGHFLEVNAAYFAALAEKDNVVNTLIQVDLSNRGTEGDWDDDSAFLGWYQDLKEKLKGLAQYPSFHSTIAKVKQLKKRPFIWCETEISSMDDHLSLETLQAEDPSSDVLRKLGDLNFGEYFDKDRPRWHVHVYRYTTGDNPKTKAVFVALRSGHSLADGVSLVSMLITSVFDEVPPKDIDERRQASIDATPVIADISNDISKKPLQSARFDLPVLDVKLLCKRLTGVWSQNQTQPVRVTLTTMLQAAILRLEARKTQEPPRISMPRDVRGTALNRLTAVPAFKTQAAAYSDDLLKWGPTNIAHGAAHQLKAGCDANNRSLEAWRVCYLKMQDALGTRYMAKAQDFIESKFSVRSRAKLYPWASKPTDWLLSSINAGPQFSSLAGANIVSSTVFLAPSSLFKKVVMLMTAGDMVSFGIMGPDGRDFATQLKQEVLDMMAQLPAVEAMDQ